MRYNKDKLITIQTTTRQSIKPSNSLQDNLHGSRASSQLVVELSASQDLQIGRQQLRGLKANNNNKTTYNYPNHYKRNQLLTIQITTIVKNKKITNAVFKMSVSVNRLMIVHGVQMADGLRNTLSGVVNSVNITQVMSKCLGDKCNPNVGGIL